VNTSKLTIVKKSTLALGAALVAMSGVLATPAHAKKNHIHIHVGVPLGIGVYGDGYGYGHSCYWLKKKAMYTGKALWWKKYKECKYG
jgi:hypothetical protein